ncbi:MAG: hypothetical protein U5K29_15955 [Acidimicrobiales bacterium]|nr:hypothetical protein [Acidimicrobiales bacterium]
MLEKAQAALATHIATPDDIAEAVAFVVAQPLRLSIPELVIRPAQTLQI